MMKLLDIAVRPAKGEPMQRVESAQLTQLNGITGDHRSKSGRRQISLLSLFSWQCACNELGQSLPWTIRRANLLLDIAPFTSADVGRILCVGPARIEICVETEPCRKMDEQVPGLRAALTPEWRGGVCGNIVLDGIIHIGDTVHWLDASSEED